MQTSECHLKAEGIRGQRKEDHEEEMRSHRIPSGEERGGEEEEASEKTSRPFLLLLLSLSLSLFSLLFGKGFYSGRCPLLGSFLSFSGSNDELNFHFDWTSGT